DLMMPVMDGFEFLAKLRESAWCDIPVAVVTAKDLSAEEREALQGLARRVIAKGAGGARTGGRRERFEEICAARQAVALESAIARAICLCARPSDGRSNAIARLTNTRDGWIAVLEDEFRAGVVA